MIQDITPHQFFNEYSPQKPKETSFVLYYEDKQVLLGRDEQDRIIFPTIGELKKTNPAICEAYTYLFTMDKEQYYLVEHVNYQDTPYRMEHTEVFREEIAQRHQCLVGITGWQLYRWYRDHQFCGRCGGKMQPDQKERMLRCEDCSHMEYPKIMPAVIVGIIHEDRILLSQYAANSNRNSYALLAGFVEIGESVEDCVRREVMEEVGLKVKNIRYYKSQPWSFTDTLLMGYYAELDGDDMVRLDEEELAMAGWFKRDEIPVEERNLSLTNEMIMAFKRGRM
jgi:NAD+ diphosphatase